jgi:hypothetical protein
VPTGNADIQNLPQLNQQKETKETLSIRLTTHEKNQLKGIMSNEWRFEENISIMTQ